MVHDPTGLRLILFVIFLDHYLAYDVDSCSLQVS